MAVSHIHSLEQKSLDQPDETRPFERGKMDTVSVGGVTIGRGRYEPGWKWSDHVKPVVNTDSCQVTHLGYVLSGRITVRMEDGSQTTYGKGDALAIPPGHDAWVEGHEACELLDFVGAAEYARKG